MAWGAGWNGWAKGGGAGPPGGIRLLRASGVGG
ncbi:putative RiPP precursor, partial [Cronobacter malonaticus]